MKRFALILTFITAAALCRSCGKGPETGDGGGGNGGEEAVYYSITVTGDYGSADISVDGTAAVQAKEGDRVTLTTRPKAGYLFVEWVVSDEDIDLEEASGGAAFVMPAHNVQIGMGFIEDRSFDVFTAIADPEFKTYCRQFDADGDGELSFAEAYEVTYMNVQWLGVSSLAGVEYFKYLEILTCPGMKQLDLSNNLSLKELTCKEGELASLDVSRNTALEFLDCHRNNLTSLDVSKNTALVTLFCNDNALEELDIKKNKALTILYCYNNRLKELDIRYMDVFEDGRFLVWCGSQRGEYDHYGSTMVLFLRPDQRAFFDTSLANLFVDGRPVNDYVVFAM